MSVTFYIDGLIDDEDLCLNVANGSARIILEELLDIREPDLCGTLDPNTVIRALATVEPRNHVRPMDDNHGIETTLNDDGVSVKKVCRVISFGYDAERIARYVSELTRISNRANVLGKKIFYS